MHKFILLTIFAVRLHAATAVKISPEHLHLLPKGKEVDAIPGDYLLRSDKIAVVIGGTAVFRDANVNTQSVQGAVITWCESTCRVRITTS